MVLSSSSQPQLLQTDSTHRQLVRYWVTVLNPNQAFLAMQGDQWALKVFSDQRMLTVAIASLSWGALSADKNIFVSIHFAKILFGGWKWTEKKQVHFLDSVMGKVKSRKSSLSSKPRTKMPTCGFSEEASIPLWLIYQHSTMTRTGYPKGLTLSLEWRSTGNFSGCWVLMLLLVRSMMTHGFVGQLQLHCLQVWFLASCVAKL